MTEQTYPELTGTEKQIAWANDIRNGVAADIEKVYNRVIARRPGVTAGREQFEADFASRRAIVMANTDATWWIRTARNMTAQQLLAAAK